MGYYDNAWGRTTSFPASYKQGTQLHSYLKASGQATTRVQRFACPCRNTFANHIRLEKKKQSLPMGYIPSIPHQTETSNPYQSLTPKAMETFLSWGHSVEGPIWFLLQILLWKNSQGRFERTFLSMWEGTEQGALEEQRPWNNRTEKKYVMTRQSRVKIKTKGILTIINQVLGTQIRRRYKNRSRDDVPLESFDYT